MGSAFFVRQITETERTRVQSQARSDSMREAAAMGIIVTKEWACRMVNSRDSHIALHGTKIPEGEKFRSISGAELEYPGDPSAPAAEVINCHCVLIPGVEMPKDRLKKGAKNDIIKEENSKESKSAKAEEIAKEFRYRDRWGDECSPIDVDSFARMPVKAQERAAEGIRKAKELLGLEELPQKIAFGSAKGSHGLYSETYRTLTLSSKQCKDPDDAYSTMVHEMTHYYDHVSGYVAEKVYKQALKELGIGANSAVAKEETIWAIGIDNRKYANDLHEVLAYSVENATIGTQSALANKILEIVRRK